MSTKPETTSPSLAALVARAAYSGEGTPPVESWNPEHCGTIDIRIARDGTWFHEGSPIGREKLVRLFSTVLRKDADGRTYLVTPVERMEIEVEDAPFVAVEMAVAGQGDAQVLTFRTNVGDTVEAGPEHVISFSHDGAEGQLKPYVHVRGRLVALLARPVMYELVGLGEEIDIEGTTMFAVRSGGEIFPIMPAAELERLSK
ncbi:DUF1285 domain-containing protein [Rhizobiaceae bacterium]|nr:DUF1285 domain-containing protein [Rhizobiaceae bacterium]